MEDINNEQPVAEQKRRHHHQYYQHHNENGMWGGVVLILLGGIFLLNNFGILDWNIWNILWRFWPIFLIVAGIDFLFGKNPAGKFFGNLLTILLIAFVLIMAASIENPAIRVWTIHTLPWLPLDQMSR